jgi:uncharacterized protein (TIGR03437 family)
MGVFAIRRLTIAAALVASARLSAQTPTPTLTPAPVSLAFTYQIGAAALPATQNLQIAGTPTGLGFNITISGAPANGAWLLPSVLSGKTNAALKIQVNPTGLAAGSYAATITITATSGSPPPVATVPVTLTVNAPAPALTLSANSFAISYTTGTPTVDPSLVRQLVISSNGTPIAATVSVVGAAWLKATPTGSVNVTGLLNTITLTADPTGLAPKSYSGTLRLATPTAVTKQTDIPVTLTVNAARPVTSSVWPPGLVQGSPASVLSVAGSQFYPNTTFAASGFSPNATVTITDAASATATEVINIPVYAQASPATQLRISMGTPLVPGIVGTAYAQGLIATGGTGPYVWSVGSGALPPGITVLGSFLVGTPTTPGTYRFTLAAADASTPLINHAWLPVRLIIHPTGTVSLRYAGAATALPAAISGTSYGPVSLTAAGGTGPYRFAATGLPSGLTLSSAGTITGTPTNAGPTGSLTSTTVSPAAALVTAGSSFLTGEGLLRLTATTPAPGGGASNDAYLEVYGPAPQITAVLNSASVKQGITSPGEIVSIYGIGLGGTAAAIFDPNTPPLPSTLPASSGTSVTVNGVSAPVLYSSASQLTCIVPYSISGPTATFLVSYSGLTSRPFSVSLAATSPGVYTANGSGTGPGAILNFDSAASDYVLNASSTAAARGSVVVIYVTGGGATSSSVVNQLIPSSPAVNPTNAPTVMIGGQAATVMASVAPPGSVPGLLQLNVTVPASAPTGGAVPVTVTMNGIDSQAGVTMAVK